MSCKVHLSLPSSASEHAVATMAYLSGDFMVPILLFLSIQGTFQPSLNKTLHTVV